MTDRPSPTTVRWIPAAAELVATLLVVTATVAIFLSWLGAHLVFLGDQVVITQADVDWYRRLVVALGVAVLGSFAAAGWRAHARHRLGWTWVWHVVMAVAGAVTAIVFSVTVVGPTDRPAPEPSPARDGPPPCYGTSGYCPGG